MLLTAVVAVLALAACSGPPSGGGGEQAPPGPGPFPVTVEHAFGSTEITRAPQRVITLGYTDPDSLLAVGVAPIGIVDWFVVPPQLAAGRSDAQISPERVDLLDVDKLLVFARNPQVQAEISARPEFAALPVARQGRTLFLFTSEQQAPVSAALGYGSVISFPYVLDRLVPVLEAMPAPPP